jgi:hypothetical protein
MTKRTFSVPTLIVREDGFCTETTTCRCLLHHFPNFGTGQTGSPEVIKHELHLGAWVKVILSFELFESLPRHAILPGRTRLIPKDEWVLT